MSTEVELHQAELAFKLALNYIFSSQDACGFLSWPWLIINKALCMTTKQLAVHKNLLKNLKYRF